MKWKQHLFAAPGVVAAVATQVACPVYAASAIGILGSGAV